MLNAIWLGLVLGAILLGGFSNRLPEVSAGAVKGAETAVTLSLGLVGIMAVWLGIMRLAEQAGFVQALGRALRPVMKWLFPEVPPEHPAMGSMLMNMAANMLGLNNAATPLGLRAMHHLESLNPHPGIATNAMCTFLAINTSSIQLVPVTAVAILAAAKSVNPTAIIGTAFLATLCSASAGIAAVKLLQPFWPAPPGVSKNENSATEANSNTSSAKPLTPIGWIVLGLYGLVILLCVWQLIKSAAPSEGAIQNVAHTISVLAIPFLISFIPLVAALKKINVYEELVEGAKEGFPVALRIIPFLVAMLVAISMFRGAGGIDLIGSALGPLFSLVHFPVELLPISLMRPLSGSGSLAMFSELVKQYGPDSLIARTAGTLYGSTETTFYVVAVYFGAVNIRRTRHAVPAGLIADLVGVIASVLICRLVFA